MKSQNPFIKKNFWVLSLFGFLASVLLLFLAFVDLPYLTMIATISSVYFLASSLPTFQFWTLPLKDVAVYFFGILGVNEWIVIFISTLMWFLNVVTSCNW
jgi:hypothetical protein